MSNVFLRPFYKNLQMEIAQTIFADNRVHHVGKLSFCNEICSMDLGLIETCKNFSLPVSILNQCFEVSKYCDELQAISSVYSDMDVLISFFNLSSMNYKERYNLVRQMQANAPKALFIEYENPERNIAYPMYYTFILGEYLTYYGQKMYATLENKWTNKTPVHAQNSPCQHEYINSYLSGGGLEGFIYDIPSQTGKTPKEIKRSHLYMGGIGLYYCEW